MTVSQIIDEKLVGKVKEKKGVLSGIVVLDINGPDGGKWTIDFDNATVSKGDTANPQVRIKMEDKDFVDMIDGTLNPATAMFGGKLKIEGDMALAAKLAMAIK